MLDESPITVGVMMTRSVQVVHPHTTLADAAQMMATHRISGLPVTDDEGNVLGMISDGDLVRWFQDYLQTLEDRLGRSEERPIPSAELLKGAGGEHSTVGKLMSREVVQTTEATPAREVALLMHEKKVKRVAVMREGRLIGIITRSDLIQTLAAELEELLPHADQFGKDLERAKVEHDLDVAEVRLRLNRALRRGRPETRS